MAIFLEDVDLLRSGLGLKKEEEYALALQHFTSLGIGDISNVAVRVGLLQTLGCLVSAILHLHENQIRHKDPELMNILLSHDGLWVTDFSTSTDFSELSQSTTGSCEQGTPKFFAPEVSAFKPNGRPADIIFSTLYISLKLFALSKNRSLDLLKRLREAKDFSSKRILILSLNGWMHSALSSWLICF